MKTVTWELKIEAILFHQFSWWIYLASYRAKLQLRFVFCTMDSQCEVDSCRLCWFIFLGIRKNF